jgi:hypothetical protein
MSTHEPRPLIKWSAIRSRAVPSNVVTPISDSSLTEMHASEVVAHPLAKSDKLDANRKASRSKSILPSKLLKSTGFSGSTGSSHL